MQIIVLEEDIGKALGQALHHRIKNRRKIICIDGIYCESGDFVDLGEPIVSGKVIPVIVKTLIFNGYGAKYDFKDFYVRAGI